MKIAVCFFGEMTFMDRFMIQNMMRCVIVPFQKHDPHRHDKIEFSYFLHTYFCPDILSFLGMIKQSFPLTSMTVHDSQVVLRERHHTMDPSRFLQHYSLHRVKKKWKSLEDLEIVVFIRLDLLFTKALSGNDIDLIFQRKLHYIFLPQNDTPFVAIGDPMAMNILADHLCDHEEPHSFLNAIQTQHRIHPQYLSLVCVRILPDGMVCPEDSRVCPYLEDLITSSPTQIRLARRKNSLPSSSSSSSTPQTVPHGPVQYPSGHVSESGISS